MRRELILMAAGIFLATLPALAQDPPDAAALIEASFNHYRGKASEAEVEMIIHRPTWERSMRMVGWTKGTDKSLIRITAPAKDEGNGTLKNGHEMWTYNPKVNRVIKLAASPDVPVLDGVGFLQQRPGQKRQHPQRLHP